MIDQGNYFRGPDDDGKTVDGPATLAQAAFENGIKYVNINHEKKRQHRIYLNFYFLLGSSRSGFNLRLGIWKWWKR